MAATYSTGTSTSGTGTSSGAVETDETQDLVASNKVEGTAAPKSRERERNTTRDFAVAWGAAL